MKFKRHGEYFSSSLLTKQKFENKIMMKGLKVDGGDK